MHTYEKKKSDCENGKHRKMKKRLRESDDQGKMHVVSTTNNIPRLEM